MGHRDELAVERADPAPFAVVHRDQLGAAEHPTSSMRFRERESDSCEP
jgi:hypothetical protein